MSDRSAGLISSSVISTTSSRTAPSPIGPAGPRPGRSFNYMLRLMEGQRDLHGRTALVTGAARGLGRAICEGLARDGAAVVATDLSDLDETVAAVELMGQRAIACEADVRDQGALDAVVR